MQHDGRPMKDYEASLITFTETLRDYFAAQALMLKARTRVKLDLSADPKYSEPLNEKEVFNIVQSGIYDNCNMQMEIDMDSASNLITKNIISRFGTKPKRTRHDKRKK